MTRIPAKLPRAFQIWVRVLMMLLATLSLAAATQAQQPPNQQAVVVLRSTVTGNQEQPKVLYIVPWQQPQGPGDLAQPLDSLVNDLFRPLDREEFRRELDYRAQQQAHNNEASDEQSP